MLLIFCAGEMKNQRNPLDSVNVSASEYAKVFCHVAQIIYSITLSSLWNVNWSFNVSEALHSHDFGDSFTRKVFIRINHRIH
jgi:hypothetical protein